MCLIFGSQNKLKMNIGKLILGLLSLGLLAGVMIYFLVYNKPHRNIEDEIAAFNIEASELFYAYSTDPKSADDEYLNQVIIIQGVVAEILKTTSNEMNIVFRDNDELFGVSCTIAEKYTKEAESITVGQDIFLKGLCMGMAMDVVLIQCVPANNKF
jgi:hypothetical protein